MDGSIGVDGRGRVITRVAIAFHRIPSHFAGYREGLDGWMDGYRSRHLGPGI